MKEFKVRITVTYTNDFVIVAKNKEEAEQIFNNDIDSYMQKVLNVGDEQINYEIEEEK